MAAHASASLSSMLTLEGHAFLSRGSGYGGGLAAHTECQCKNNAQTKSFHLDTADVVA